jgi:hypothetical protein
MKQILEKKKKKMLRVSDPPKKSKDKHMSWHPEVRKAHSQTEEIEVKSNSDSNYDRKLSNVDQTKLPLMIEQPEPEVSCAV